MHCEVLPLNVACGDMFRIGTPCNPYFPASDALCGTIAGFGLPIIPIQLDQHRVVYIVPKSVLDGL
jgi:hypothetical protein